MDNSLSIYYYTKNQLVKGCATLDFDNRFIRAAIKELYGNVRTFAAEVGLTERQVLRKLDNTSQLTREEIVDWSEKLKVKDNEIYKYFFVAKS